MTLVGKRPDFGRSNYLPGNTDDDKETKNGTRRGKSGGFFFSSFHSEVKAGQQLLLEASEEALREDKSPMPRCVCGSYM